MAIESPAKKPAEQKQTGKEVEKKEFDLNVAVKKKEAGVSHSQIAKHFGITDPELRKKVNRVGLGLAWDEIGKYNPDFILEDYKTSGTSRKKLVAKYGFKSENAFSSVLNQTKEAKSKPPLNIRVSTIRVGDRKVPVEQHEYFASTHPLKQLSQEQVNTLVTSIIEKNRQGQTNVQIANELRIPLGSYGRRIQELGIAEKVEAARKAYWKEKKLNGSGKVY